MHIFLGVLIAVATFAWTHMAVMYLTAPYRRRQRHKACLEQTLSMEVENYGQPMSISVLQELGRDFELQTVLEGKWLPNPMVGAYKPVDGRSPFAGRVAKTVPPRMRPTPPVGRGSASPKHPMVVLGVDRITPDRAALNENHKAIGYGTGWSPYDAGKVLEHLERAHGFRLSETVTGSELALKHAEFHWPGTDGHWMHGIAHCNKCDESYAVRGDDEHAMVIDAQRKLKAHHKEKRHSLRAGVQPADNDIVRAVPGLMGTQYK